ncbi:MAG: tat pathway signal sequence [Labedaea sp.]
MRRVAAVALSAVTLLGVAGCGSSTSRADAPPSSPAPAVLSVEPPSSVPSAPVSSATSVPAPPPTAPKAKDCPLPKSGFDCDFQRRFAGVQAYLAKRPGTVGIVVRDRQTGAVWRNEHAGDLTWTASTIKLGMTVDLLLRDRSGAITLSTEDRSLIKAMLHSSDDKAADTLWFRYAGADHLAFNNAFPGYGLTSLQPQRGFSNFYPYWGFQKCTPDDLDRLIGYVLTTLPPDLRDYILGELRTVAANQQWGVWGAGPAAKPGNKDGWSEEQGGWVMNTVGFVGPGERYTLAAMNNLRGKGGYDAGKATVTEVARQLFAGRF